MTAQRGCRARERGDRILGAISTTTTLPNGLTLETSSSREGAFLLSELFERDSYTRHGIELADGATVLDIGANVGAFSVALVQQYRDLRLVLFEPIPATFALLQRNAARLLTGANVTLVNAGVAAAPGQVTFHVPPESTMATAYPKPRDPAARSGQRVGLETWVRAGLEDFRRARQIRPRVAAALERALERPLLRPLVLAAILTLVGVSAIAGRLRTKQVECELTTISRAMREYGISTVDLAKIDVEGAEWAVLQGIDESDWPRIRQLALEVHDVDDRVARMRELLEAKGYRVLVDDADWATHRLMGVHMMYASRDASDQQT